jgi:alpha-glucosidase
MPEQEWWRDSVIYQIYVRSFTDSDGNGIGDLAGIESRLDYLKSLGVDGIWLNPCYPSPQRDHGYDVADYFAIEPDYGSLEVFDRFLAAAHERGLRVLMDLVPNHCSSDHPWFQAALKAGPGSRERARFIFRDGRGQDGELPPNNWRSVFGGPAWTRVTESDGSPGQWYLHLFDVTQPDFDWSNPEVAEYFDKVLRFWFDRGIDGFRIDVAHGMAKEPALSDWPVHPNDPSDYNLHVFNRPEVHEIHRRWRAIADSYGPERSLTLIGEIWVPEPVDLVPYLRSDELSQAFYFDLLARHWDAKEWHDSIETALRNIGDAGATITWVLSNHDVHRTVTRLGQPPHVHHGRLIEAARYRGPVDVELGMRRARAAILLLLALPGSVYLYQGEELGLPEWLDLPDQQRQDPMFYRSEGRQYGRDGCRVPMPWNHDRPTYGFSRADSAADPWLPQPEWLGNHAVDVAEADHHSMLALYREALRSRRATFTQPPLEGMTWDDSLSRDDVVVIRRGNSRAVVAFGDDPVELPDEWGRVVVASEALDGRTLPGTAAAWLSA